MVCRESPSQKKEGRESKSKSGGKVKVLLSAQKVLKFYTLHSVCVLARNSGQAMCQRLRDMLFGGKTNIEKILKKINVFP